MRLVTRVGQEMCDGDDREKKDGGEVRTNLLYRKLVQLTTRLFGRMRQSAWRFNGGMGIDRRT